MMLGRQTNRDSGTICVTECLLYLVLDETHRGGGGGGGYRDNVVHEPGIAHDPALRCLSSTAIECYVWELGQSLCLHYLSGFLYFLLIKLLLLTCHDC